MTKITGLQNVAGGDPSNIAFFYFGITFLPGFLIADLGIRGSLAIFIFGSLAATTAQILVPIFLVWTLNNCLPAVIGLWFLVKQK